MLILSRKNSESILIGDDITIMVVDIRGDKVRLGIEAPKETPIHRSEVYEAIQRENEQTSAVRGGRRKPNPQNSRAAKNDAVGSAE